LVGQESDFIDDWEGGGASFLLWGEPGGGLGFWAAVWLSASRFAAKRPCSPALRIWPDSRPLGDCLGDEFGYSLGFAVEDGFEDWECLIELARIEGGLQGVAFGIAGVG
jgi:hypothetical protein